MKWPAKPLVDPQARAMVWVRVDLREAGHPPFIVCFALVPTSISGYATMKLRWKWWTAGAARYPEISQMISMHLGHAMHEAQARVVSMSMGAIASWREIRYAEAEELARLPRLEDRDMVPCRCCHLDRPGSAPACPNCGAVPLGDPRRSWKYEPGHHEKTRQEYEDGIGEPGVASRGGDHRTAGGDAAVDPAAGVA